MKQEISSSVKRARLLAEVPPFQPVVLQLLRLAGDSSQPLSRIVSLLRADAVLAANILRLASSPLFGSRWEVTSILEALSLLGLDRINVFIVTTALRGLAHARHSPLTRACWRHNLATALIGEKLSLAAGLPPEKCYISGLLHDIGRLALLRVFPEYGDSMKRAAAGGQDLLAAERDLFDMDHAETGGWLLLQWGFPIELQNVACWHEAPLDAPASDRDLIRLVAAASGLADLMEFRVFSSPSESSLESIAAHLPGVAARQLSGGLLELTEYTRSRIDGIEQSLC